MTKIINCFTFFNELDLLEIRLNECKWIDKFIIIEAKKTFTGKDKPLFYQENKNRFKEFHSKIKHIIVNDLPYDFARSNLGYQRIQCFSGLTKCNDDDIIIFSDADEIPKENIIKKYGQYRGIQGLNMRVHYYYLNVVREVNCSTFTTIMTYADLLKYYTKQPLLRGINQRQHTITDAGWHFSYLGDVKNIQYKINSFAHTEKNIPKYTNTEILKYKIKNMQDLFNRGNKLYRMDIDNSFPQYVVNNQQKFKHLILK